MWYLAPSAYSAWTRGDVEISASSCSWLRNGEAVRHPWCSWLDVYASTHLAVILVVLSSGVPFSCSLIGVLVQAVAMYVSVSEQYQWWIPLSVPDFFLQGLRQPWYGCPPAAFPLAWVMAEDLPTPTCCHGRCKFVNRYVGPIERLHYPFPQFLMIDLCLFPLSGYLSPEIHPWASNISPATTKLVGSPWFVPKNHIFLFVLT